MTGIYKITNLLNNKSYIWQSIHIERRWEEHKRTYLERESVLYKAMKKYGVSNFKFEIICECLAEELDFLEKEYINNFSTLVPNGYNVQLWGKSWEQVMSEKIKKIISLLKETEIPFETISNDFDYDISNIYKINSGKIWKSDNESYPLRKLQIDKDSIYNKTMCECWKTKSKWTLHCAECAKKIQRVVERPDRDTLLKEIALTNFVAVGKKYGVTDNSIRKWCVGYDLPTHSQEIKELYNKEKGIVIPKKEKTQIYPVEQYDPLTGELLNTYPSAAAAARALGRSKGSHINEVCNGKGKTAHGFVWKYRK